MLYRAQNFRKQAGVQKQKLNFHTIQDRQAMNFSGLHFIFLCFPVYLISPGISRAQTPGDSAGTPKIHLDMRTAVSEGRRLRMGGASIGWEWGTKREEVTLGYYWTGKRGKRDIRSMADFQVPFRLPASHTITDIRFVSGGYWMTIRDWRRWKLSSPVEAGFGHAKFSTTDSDGPAGNSEIHRLKIVPVQLALYGEWRATRWLGTGLQVGYRHYMTGNSQPPLRQLGGPYYRFRVLVYVQTFYDWPNRCFRKEAVEKPFY